jgi:hypothetical protein
VFELDRSRIINKFSSTVLPQYSDNQSSEDVAKPNT